MSPPNQSSLFDEFPEREPAPEPAVVAVPVAVASRKAAAAKGPESAARKAFRRRLRRLENLRQELADHRVRLENAVSFRRRELLPLMEQLQRRRPDCLRLLIPWQKSKRLTNRQRRLLRALLASQFDQMLASGPLPEEFHRLYRDLTGEKPIDPGIEAFEVMRSEMRAGLDELGIAFDLSGLRHDLPPEELAAKMAEIEAAIKARMAQVPKDPDPAPPPPPPKKRPKPLSPAQAARAEAKAAQQAKLDEFRERGVGKLYRRLAKALHPDLERDPAERARKVQLMQELTTAYEAGDLYQLLQLEVAWLQAEEISTNAEEHLALYAELLKEQEQELKDAIEDLDDDPRYEEAWMPDGPFGWMRLVNEEDVDYLVALNRQLDQSIQNLQGPHALTEIRDLLKAFAANLDDD